MSAAITATLATHCTLIPLHQNLNSEDEVSLPAVQVFELQTHLQVLPEPDHPDATVVQSLNFGKQPEWRFN